MDQEVGHLYARFGGLEEDEVRVKGQRLAKTWMDKAVDSVERARRCVGLRFQGTTGLDEPRQCRHDGPPAESRSCEIQARTATRQADRAWRRGPRRIGELCGGLPGGAGEPDGDSAPAEAPDGGSEFSPGSSDSKSDRDFFESCDPRSPDPEEDPEPSGAESGKLKPLEAGPRGSESSESESSETESEDSDSSEAESGESDPFDMEAREEAHSLPAQATPIPTRPPPIQRSQTQAVPTQVSRSHPHRTPRQTLLLRHHLWRRLRSSAGR